MRTLILACMLLAGCSAEQMAANRAAAQAEQHRRAAYAASPTGIADLGCQTKTQFAMAARRPTGILDLEGVMIANQMHANCLNYWRRTGQLP